MKKYKFYLINLIMITFLFSCSSAKKGTDTETFKYKIDQFADIKILRYQVPGFEQLSLGQKKLIYYLSEAALSGRDITWDQLYKHNLFIRRVLEGIVKYYDGDRNTEDFQKFMVYVKRVWFSNGIHHHYSSDKFKPDFSREYFTELINHSPSADFLKHANSKEELLNKIIPILFDPEVDAKGICQDTGKDLIINSANNFYEGLTQQEVEEYNNKVINKADSTPVSYGLNSKYIKENGQVKEKTYRLNGMYTAAIEKIIYWLEQAVSVAENEKQKQVMEKLIEYYKTGNLETFDEYSILWVKDLDSRIDFVNGFIEVYGDPLGKKATWEALVNFKDIKATRRAESLSANAQWFEDHSPVDERFRKKEVKGVSAKVITAAMLGGELYPATAIGINLPNADWIRKEYGSKSVTIENIAYSYDQESQGSGFNEEFAYSEDEIKMIKKHGFLAGNLHTDLHECLGHGSGQLMPGVTVDALKNYFSTLEEARADLFALYYLMDKKMVELGLIPSLDVAKTEYTTYIRNGLITQLTRIQPGNDIEEAHMRDRQLISKWCYEKGQADNIISMVEKEGNTYAVVNDYFKLRNLFGSLLKEVQRIKSEGDYEAGKELIEKYGVKVDRKLNEEVLARYEKLKLAPYSGFINPKYTPVYENGAIADINIECPDDYVKQMLYYSENYSFLPDYN